MHDFEYCNPTKIIFGKDTVAKVAEAVPAEGRILLLYGGGSIKQNGVYDAVTKALVGRDIVEFGGIEANPQFATCMKAVETIKTNRCDFILAVGGGSVFDGCKFISAAVTFTGDPWSILSESATVADGLPWGGILTLPATGSEMNPTSVISNEDRGVKLFFAADPVRPQFSILDPTTTFSLDKRQTANGIADAYVHVLEQYLTVLNDAPLQDRQAEAVLLTLLEEGPKNLANPQDYKARANIMWCATNGLNGWLGCGQVQDWATHMIGHELTALYGVDHARSLAIVLPGLWQHQRKRKAAKLLHYAERIWGITEGTEDERIDAAITKTEAFFNELGIGTTFADYDIPEDACELVAKRMASRNMLVGEHADLGEKEVSEILHLRILTPST